MAAVFFAAASELATLTNTFTVASAVADPTTVTLTVTSPAGVATTYTYAGSTITKDSTGVYHKDVDVSSEDGMWQYEWIGTGAASDHESGSFTVYPTDLGHLYASVTALKSRFGITSTTDDFELHGACFAASRLVEYACDRIFWRTASTEVRTFEARDYYSVELGPFNDLITVSTLKTDDGLDSTFSYTWAATDYQLQPINPTAGPEDTPYTRIQAVGTRLFPRRYIALSRSDLVQVTGTWGWAKVPFPVTQATLILAAEMFKMKDAPLGVAGFGDLGVVRVKDNPLVARYLRPYMRRPVLAA